jgi:hypothetical protein
MHTDGNWNQEWMRIPTNRERTGFSPSPNIHLELGLIKSSYCKWFAFRSFRFVFLVNMDQAIINPANQLTPSFTRKWEQNADRIGVIASAICAIHCVATPFLLLLLPTFGKVWSHPASHWGMALIVIPIAALMISKGYLRHRRKWIIGIGSAGILFVLAGAAAPYFDTNPNAAISGVDACCVAISTTGNVKKFHIPAASILTTLGGILLIATHVTNLCRCPSCFTKKL